MVTVGSLTKGQNVEFELSSTKKGLSATVVITENKRKSPVLVFSMILIILTLILSMYLSRHMSIVVAFFIALNIITGIMYAYDKMVSGSTLIRIPEKLLHGLAFLGGSPSALIAQILFRHKIIKHSFQIVYWRIVSVQLLMGIFFLLYIIKYQQ
ncbi:MAG: uncharacterized membrane protein YsdA (DUF1294 family) [Candidatus Endobugula sp.]|jgi:uncharacterized membrane protein YsdA (DUF1294 family)